MNTNNLKSFHEYIVPLIATGSRCLEISPGRGVKPLWRMAKHLSINYETCEWPDRGRLAVRMADENTVIVPANTYDAVWSANTLEHVRRPWLWFAELARITKPGGFVAVLAPFTWREHPEQHEWRDGKCNAAHGHFDGWRILPDGIDLLFQEAGLQTELARLVNYEETSEYERGENRGLTSIDLVAVGRKPA